MALIAFGAATEGTVDSAGSLTFSSPNVSGSDTILFVGIVTSGATPETDRVTTVTHNGDALTRINTSNGGGSSNVRSYLYYRVAPDAGVNNVVVSVSPNGNIRAVAAFYTGAKQTSVPDAQVTDSVSATNSQTKAITTAADKAWVVSFHSNNSGEPIASTGITSRHTGSPYGFGDSNGPVTPHGSYSMTWTIPGGPSFGEMVMASFANSNPVGGARIINFI